MEMVIRTEIPVDSHLDDREIFRNVSGHFASGVTNITTRAEQANYGLTASAVSSLSLDSAMVLVCINKKTGTPRIISKVKVSLAEVQAAHAEEEMPWRFIADEGERWPSRLRKVKSCSGEMCCNGKTIIERVSK